MTKKRLTPVARNLRERATDAEARLWRRLRGAQLENTKFVRQFPIGPFIADFACRSLRFTIELDGGQHSDSARDEERSAIIAAYGYRTLRFWNNEVLANTDGVIEAIRQEILNIRSEEPPHPDPLPQGRGSSV